MNLLFVRTGSFQRARSAERPSHPSFHIHTTEPIMNKSFVLASLVAAFALAACGKKEEAPAPAPAPVAAPAPAPAPAEPASAPEASASAASAPDAAASK